MLIMMRISPFSIITADGIINNKIKINCYESQLEIIINCYNELSTASV